MEALFLKLLNMSINAGWLVLAVVLIRLLLKKAPKAFRLVLWGFVALRLIFPVSIESVLSLIPSKETVPADFLYSKSPAIQSGISALNSTVNPIISDSLAPNTVYSANPTRIITFIASVVWLAGMAAMIIYASISCISIHRRIREAIPLKKDIYICDRIDTPFIFGLLRPKIYLPSSIDSEDSEYVIAHERSHLAGKDYIWKPLGFTLLTVYWFNPAIWLAYILLCRDIELACDERVIKEMGADIKKPYSNALINCSVPRKMISACPLAFGETGVKGRIKSVLNYKKPAFWAVAAAVILSIITGVCFLTNPADSVTAVINQKGYRLYSQQEKSIEISLNSSDLAPAVNTEKGKSYGKNEITVYKNNLSSMYLEKAYTEENDGQKWLTLIFNFAYTIQKEGTLTLPYELEFSGGKTASFSNSVYMADEAVSDGASTYKNSAYLRGAGPDEKIYVCVKLDTFKLLKNTLTFTLNGFQNTKYSKKSFTENFTKDKWQTDNYGISCNVISAECDDITYEYIYGTVNEEFPYINVKWTNNTADTLCYGDEFVIYKNDEIYNPKEAMGFDAILNTVGPQGEAEEIYHLSCFDLPSGDYRLEKEFYLQSDPDKKYRAFISFSVDLRYSFLGKQYKGEKIVYEDGSYSSVFYTDEAIPQFSVSDVDFSLLTNDYPEPSISSSFYKIDGLQKFTLKKDNFDKLMTDTQWDEGYSARNLRKNNLNAFSAFDLSGRMYYLLEQKNGDIYIAQGYTETNHIRWIFKMTETDSVNAAVDDEFITYVYKESPDPWGPALRLDYRNNTFTFTTSVFSSYLAMGSFSTEGNTLTCKTDDGLYAYVFDITDDGLSFRAERSSPITAYKYSADSNPQVPVPDGALFELFKEGTTENGRNQNPYFNATVLSVSENAVLVEPFEGEEIRKTADKLTVSTDVISTNPVPRLEKGTEIRVVYNGYVQETYPARISGVFAIYLLSDIE